MLATKNPDSISRWVWIPALSAVVCILLIPATMGAGVVLAPISVVLTVVAARRLGRPFDWRFRLGAVLTGALGIVFLWTLALVAYDVLT